ncbi:acyl-CoA carboxylase epsilon subunit-like protein [Streptomyces sp. TLI_55]|uniref:acyl-CoA carboxylase subunit epsilon n=1 Tax=Streptomyces sp. TLI_55 TaxID=1938861 RepID=UPI000BCB1402|nr:acyl-CoA carboxylase subunit epsilon [Streptomyces sp. TLI_55]SNX88256.1 acyl-CoA carboxylase epsilon subunit-like protein [Streptomyces sp. TLI_55]
METGDAVIRVERGRPDEAELAAVVAVLLSVRAGAGEDETPGEPSAAEIRWWAESDRYAAPESWR